MITDKFVIGLDMVRLENSLLLLTYHLKQLGYEDFHQICFEKIRKNSCSHDESESTLINRIEEIKNLGNSIFYKVPSGKLEDLAKKLYIIRDEFQENYYKHLKFFKEIKNEELIKFHRVCRVASIFDCDRYLTLSVFPRGL